MKYTEYNKMTFRKILFRLILLLRKCFVLEHFINSECSDYKRVVSNFTHNKEDGGSCVTEDTVTEVVSVSLDLLTRCMLNNRRFQEMMRIDH